MEGHSVKLIFIEETNKQEFADTVSQVPSHISAQRHQKIIKVWMLCDLIWSLITLAIMGCMYSDVNLHASLSVDIFLLLSVQLNNS